MEDRDTEYDIDMSEEIEPDLVRGGGVGGAGVGAPAPTASM